MRGSWRNSFNLYNRSLTILRKSMKLSSRNKYRCWSTMRAMGKSLRSWGIIISSNRKIKLLITTNKHLLNIRRIFRWRWMRTRREWQNWTNKWRIPHRKSIFSHLSTALKKTTGRSNTKKKRSYNNKRFITTNSHNSMSNNNK